MTAPRNIVHVSAQDILDDRIKHVKQSEINAISSQGQALSAVSFKDSLVVSSATSLGTFLTLKYQGVEYAIPLFEV